MILLFVSLLQAEPLMTKLEEGDTAPFNGRLLNDEAIVSIISKQEITKEQCEIEMDLEYSLELTNKQFEIDYLTIEKNTLQKRYDSLIEIREEEIALLKRQVKPERSYWAFFGGFVLGTAASLGTYYAANKIQ